jgi:transcriptional accessory protein Tex/SPT6
LVGSAESVSRIGQDRSQVDQVGQYQHDVDQKLLKKLGKRRLRVASTMSRSITNMKATKNFLTFVSGISPANLLALWRTEIRTECFHDPEAPAQSCQMGPKTFEQNA